MDYSIHSYNIITLKGNATSEAYAEKCKQSCLDADVDPESIILFDAVDGVRGDLRFPENVEDKIAGIKLHKFLVTKTEAACFYSHFLLWKKCVEENKPLIILEHDTRILRPLFVFPFINCILYLGNENYGVYEDRLEQYVKAPSPEFSNTREGAIDRTHAYAIDPVVANKLITKTMINGIGEPVDHHINLHDFCIIQPVPMIATVDVSSSKAKEGDTTISHMGDGVLTQVGWVSPLEQL